MFFLSHPVHSDPATAVVVPIDSFLGPQVQPRRVPQTWDDRPVRPFISLNRMKTPWNPHDCNILQPWTKLYQPLPLPLKCLANFLAADSLPHRCSMTGWGELMDFLKNQTSKIIQDPHPPWFPWCLVNIPLPRVTHVPHQNSMFTLQGSGSSYPVPAATAADPATCRGVGTISTRSMGDFNIFQGYSIQFYTFFQDSRDIPSMYIIDLYVDFRM